MVLLRKQAVRITSEFLVSTNCSAIFVVAFLPKPNVGLTCNFLLDFGNFSPFFPSVYHHFCSYLPIFRHFIFQFFNIFFAKFSLSFNCFSFSFHHFSSFLFNSVFEKGFIFFFEIFSTKFFFIFSDNLFLHFFNDMFSFFHDFFFVFSTIIFLIFPLF